MWSQICVTNPTQISVILQKYIDILSRVKDYVDNSDRDAIHEMFAESREYRNSISITTKGPVLSSYAIFCEIEDKEGALNSFTSLLSASHINIRNFEIIHNREYKDGALRIDFYDEHSANKAFEILCNNGYTVYR